MLVRSSTFRSNSHEIYRRDIVTPEKKHYKHDSTATINYNETFKLSKNLDVKAFLMRMIHETNYSLFAYNFFKETEYLKYLSDDFFDKKLEKKSLINFIRYFNDIDCYFKNRNLIIDIDNNGFIKFKLFSQNKDESYLDLTFNKNGHVEYLILDKSYDPSENKAFVMRGNIETSDKQSKSYKIHRLMVIIRHLDLEDGFYFMNYFTLFKVY